MDFIKNCINCKKPVKTQKSEIKLNTPRAANENSEEEWENELYFQDIEMAEKTASKIVVNKQTNLDKIEKIDNMAEKTVQETVTLINLMHLLQVNVITKKKNCPPLDKFAQKKVEKLNVIENEIINLTEKSIKTLNKTVTNFEEDDDCFEMAIRESLRTILDRYLLGSVPKIIDITHDHHNQ